MKKIILLAAVAAVAGVSCKKNRTCKCTTIETGPGSSNGTYSSTFTIKATKKKAKDYCQGLNHTSTSGSYTDQRTCDLQ